MSLDIVGPANAPNATTVRPTDTRSFGASDSWMQDCTSSTSNDGTKVQAGFLNAVIGQLRGLIRGNGQTAGSVDVVTQNNADDNMALKAVQQLIQRGQVLFGVAGGTAAAITVALSPAPPELKQGMRLSVLMASAPTGPTTINFNALGAKSIVKAGGVALSGKEWSAGDIVTMGYDGTNFQIGSASTRPVLTAATTYYVNGTTGSDTNDGLTTGTAFQTIQKAVNTMAKFDNNGFNVTISVADYATGYAQANLPRITGSGICLITGNITTPGNVLSGGFVGVGTNGTYWIQGFKIVSTGDAIAGDLSGTIFYINNCEFGACSGPAHIVMQRGAVGVLAGTAQGVSSPTCKISGNCPSHLLASDGGNIAVYPQALTISGTPNFSTAFYYTLRNGVITAPTGQLYSSISGSATGARYNCLSNGVIDTAGEGASYLPGSSAGVTASGGQYL